MMTLPKVDYGEVSLLEGKPYYRYDFYLTQEDLDAGMTPNDEYYDVVEMLETNGLRFTEPYLEHDCLTGHIEYIDD